jgi:hypothetical protein
MSPWVTLMSGTHTCNPAAEHFIPGAEEQLAESISGIDPSAKCSTQYFCGSYIIFPGPISQQQIQSPLQKLCLA